MFDHFLETNFQVLNFWSRFSRDPLWESFIPRYRLFSESQLIIPITFQAVEQTDKLRKAVLKEQVRNKKIAQVLLWWGSSQIIRKTPTNDKIKSDGYTCPKAREKVTLPNRPPGPLYQHTFTPEVYRDAHFLTFLPKLRYQFKNLHLVF